MRTLSLIVATLGRDKEIIKLFESLGKQTNRDFEIIIVDQNEDARIKDVIDSRDWPFDIIHIRRSDVRGLSLARNVGISASSGEVLLFPDDDCWYPPWLFQRALDTLKYHAADIVTGRAADEAGKSINARYKHKFCRITAKNAFETQIEWMLFVKADVFSKIGGFDIDIGVGARTPWQSCEGPDFVIRALKNGFVAYFDPSLYGHHKELVLKQPNKFVRTKAFGYALGMGYVMTKHDYNLFFALHRISRPLAKFVLSGLRLDFALATYYFLIFYGRAQAYFLPSRAMKKLQTAVLK